MISINKGSSSFQAFKQLLPCTVSMAQALQVRASICGPQQNKACVQDAMEQAQALQVKAGHDITNCKEAVATAEQKLQRAQQEAAEAAEAAWRRQVADHEAAVRLEQKSYQAEQVTHHESCS